MIRKVFLLMTFPVFLSLALPGQDTTRTDLLREKRYEKVRNLHPYQYTTMEKILRKAESFKLVNQVALGFKGFFPHLGGLRSGAGFSPGINYTPTAIYPEYHFSATTTFSFRGYQGYQGMAGLLRRQWQIWGYGQLRRSPQDTYYGIGSNALQENRSSYRLDDLKAGGAVSYNPHPAIRAFAWTYYLKNKVKGGGSKQFPNTRDLFTEENTPGLTEDTEFLVGAIRLVFDSRNSLYLKDYTAKLALSDEPIKLRPSNPTYGTLVSLQASRFNDVGSGRFAFTRYDLEFQQYLSFYRSLQVLAFRAFANISRPDRGARVPFYLQQTLGGSRALRGYGRFRFRDNSVLLFNAEYRYKIWSLLDVGIFYELGDVYPDEKYMTLKNLKNSYGVSLRFNSVQYLITRLDFGFSDEGLHVILKWSNVF